MSDNTIYLKVSKHPGPQWGPDPLTDEQARVVAQNVLKLAQSFARREFPGTHVVGEVTEDYTETMIYGHPANAVQRIGYRLAMHGVTEEMHHPGFEPENAAAASA